MDKIPSAFGILTPAERPFDLSAWSRKIQEDWFERVTEGNRRRLSLAGIDPDNQPTISVEEPLDEEFLEARRRFTEHFEQLVTEGIAAGYLEHDGCYECGGELKATTNVTTWTTQPNPDFDPDKPNPYAEALAGDTITIPRASKEAP